MPRSTRCSATRAASPGCASRTWTTDATREACVQGVFIAIGHKPNTDILSKRPARDGRRLSSPRAGATATRRRPAFRRVRCRRRYGPHLPPGGDFSRHRLHGRTSTPNATSTPRRLSRPMSRRAPAPGQPATQERDAGRGAETRPRPFAALRKQLQQARLPAPVSSPAPAKRIRHPLEKTLQRRCRSCTGARRGGVSSSSGAASALVRPIARHPDSVEIHRPRSARGHANRGGRGTEEPVRARPETDPLRAAYGGVMMPLRIPAEWRSTHRCVTTPAMQAVRIPRRRCDPICDRAACGRRRQRSGSALSWW